MQSNLPELMQKKNVSIYQLMELTGLSKQTLTRARGDRIRNCSLQTLEKIAAALQVPTRDLFREDK